MKVVLFCGGLGMRLRDYSDQVPKPMVPVGSQPILWHIMKYYASFGHTDFILCLGHLGESIKKYFLEYNEATTNDFVYARGGRRIDLLQRDIQDWTITFVDTGRATNIGGRLLRVREHLEDEEMFLANYADTLTDLDLDGLVADFAATDSVAGFTCVKPPYSFHLVDFGEDSRVKGIHDVRDSGMWMNGGYFVLRREIFDNLHDGEELVIEGFDRLLRKNKLHAYRHEGFWSCMDTFKEKKALDDMVARGDTPWQRWRLRAA
jgi:glucose-1-phosphate cytidylyltransferase